MPTLYVTAPPAAAEELATSLVEERLAACVNRVPCSSTYRWEGAVEAADEEILFVKTTDGGHRAAVEFVEAEHPHDVPCIETFEEASVLDAYAEWVAASVATPDGD